MLSIASLLTLLPSWVWAALSSLSGLLLLPSISFWGRLGTVALSPLAGLLTPLASLGLGPATWLTKWLTILGVLAAASGLLVWHERHVQYEEDQAADQAIIESTNEDLIAANLRTDAAEADAKKARQDAEDALAKASDGKATVTATLAAKLNAIH